jgi:hypothetical protein
VGHYIIHHKGAYNFYSTISDGARLESAITLDQLKDFTKQEFGDHGLRMLDDRLSRANKTGSSEYYSNLENTILSNRAGENEKHLSKEEFIKKFLTLD